MIERAHKMGLLTTPYAFNQDEAVQMASGGADIIVAHMGLTTSGSIGAKTAVSIEESVVRVQNIADAAHRINPNVIVLCHGGMILETLFFLINFLFAGLLRAVDLHGKVYLILYEAFFIFSYQHKDY